MILPQVAGPKAKAAALKALELDDSYAGAHEALAVVLAATDWDGPAPSGGTGARSSSTPTARTRTRTTRIS